MFGVCQIRYSPRMSDMEPVHRNYDSVTVAMNELRKVAAQASARIEEMGPAESIAREAYTLEVIKAAAHLRDEAERLTRIAVEVAHREGVDISERRFAQAAKVSNSTVNRWFAEPLLYDAAAVKTRKRPEA